MEKRNRRCLFSVDEIWVVRHRQVFGHVDACLFQKVSGEIVRAYYFELFPVKFDRNADVQVQQSIVVVTIRQRDFMPFNQTSCRYMIRTNKSIKLFVFTV